MTLSMIRRSLAVAFPLVVFGCGELATQQLLTTGSDSDAGVHFPDVGIIDAGRTEKVVDCRSAGRVSCDLAVECYWHECTDCSGNTEGRCFSDEVDVDCPRFNCDDYCHSLSEADCLQAFSCAPQYCPTCTGQAFLGCFGNGEQQVPCAPPHCVCDGVDEAGCIASAACHPVYQNEPCPCTGENCCLHFSYCAEGGAASCYPPPGGLCDGPAPVCDPPYTVGYDSGCPDGCVRTLDCPS